MITIQPMPKKLSQVNGFKAPEEWYALVLKIAEERKTTVGGAIQYVFNLGLPIYKVAREIEVGAIDKATNSMVHELSDHSKKKSRSLA